MAVAFVYVALLPCVEMYQVGLTKPFINTGKIAMKTNATINSSTIFIDRQTHVRFISLIGVIITVAMNNYENVPVKKNTKKRLTALMRKGTTYDRAINVLIDTYKGDINAG
jgi:hypothetical protein